MAEKGTASRAASAPTQNSYAAVLASENGLLASKFASSTFAPAASRNQRGSKQPHQKFTKGQIMRSAKKDKDDQSTTASTPQKRQNHTDNRASTKTANTDAMESSAPPKESISSSQRGTRNPAAHIKASNTTEAVAERSTSSQVQQSQNSMPKHTARAEHTSAMSEQKVVQGAITSAMLNQARKEALNTIGRRGVTRSKDSTTSQRDLDIARKLLTPNNKTNAVTENSSPQSKSSNQRLAPSKPSQQEERPCTVPEALDQTKVSVATTELVQNEPGTQDQKHHTGSDPYSIDGRFQGKSDHQSFSNASSASQASNDSVITLHLGRRINHSDAMKTQEYATLDDKLRHRPSGWDYRPEYTSDSPELRDHLNKWIHVVQETASGKHSLTSRSVPLLYINDLRFHADGLHMVLRDLVVNQVNAEHYGYKDVNEITQYVRPLNIKDFEEDWGKLDMSKPENSRFKEETTENLVSGWLEHYEARRQKIAAQVSYEVASTAQSEDIEGLTNIVQPKIGIHIRPAYHEDLVDMTNIYNWYVQNSVLPAEVSPITESDMIIRYDDSKASRLPMFVAVATDYRAAYTDDTEGGIQSALPPSHSAEAAIQQHRTKMEDAKIVGWASAQDFTASDFVERISAELEIYVDPTFRRLGIGSCLFDQLLAACDRGYLQRGGYDFHCPQELMHLHTTGGGRDLHKLILVVRKTTDANKKIPKRNYHRTTQGELETVKGEDDWEDDYEVWLKKWLESWGFQVRGTLHGVGAKEGRFLDVVHFDRDTGWQPAEGQIPDPMPGTV